MLLHFLVWELTRNRSKFGSKIGGPNTKGCSKTEKTDRKINRRMARVNRDPAAGVVAEVEGHPHQAEVAEVKVTTSS